MRDGHCGRLPDTGAGDHDAQPGWRFAAAGRATSLISGFRPSLTWHQSFAWGQDPTDARRSRFHPAALLHLPEI